MMPKMDGIETTKIIRDMGYHGAIVALTANAVAGQEDMFLRNRFDDYISKPIELIRLNAALDKWIPKEKQKSPAEVSSKHGSNDGEGEVDFRKFFIDGVNIQNGIALSGGSGAHYLHALAMFYEDGFEKVKVIKYCLETDDLQLYTTHIHGLKSAAASIGAEQFSETAMMLETAGKDNNQVYISEHTPKFFVELEALLSDIGLVLKELKAEKNTNVTSVDIDTLTIELVKLKDALDGFDSEGIDQAVNVLEDYEDAVNYGADVKGILQDVLIGEYDNALVLINEMLVRLGEES
jgi:HPt (histidine-containing phosphotransfer) domain-containing protein